MAEFGSEIAWVRDSPLAVAKAIVRQIRDDDVPFMAGSIAYQAFASLVPLLVLLFLALTVVGDQEFARQVVEVTEGVLPQNAQELVRNAVVSDDTAEGAGVSIIGLVTVLWGSLKIFRGLDKAFSEIYETGEENTLLDQVRDGAIVLLVLGVAVAGMVGAISVFAAFGPLSRALSFLALIVGLTLAFLPMYTLFPDAEMAWVDALPGAVVAAVGWVGLQFLFQLYVQVANSGGSSGVLGAILLLLLWLYFSGLVLLLAAVVNAVLLGEGRSPEAEAAEDGADVPDGVHTRAAERIGNAREGPPWQPPDEELEPRASAEGEGAEETEVDGEPGPAPAALRRRARALERRLHWHEQPLHARLRSQLFGDGPPPVPKRPPRRQRSGGGETDGADSV